MYLGAARRRRFEGLATGPSATLNKIAPTLPRLFAAPSLLEASDGLAAFLVAALGLHAAYAMPHLHTAGRSTSGGTSDAP